MPSNRKLSQDPVFNNLVARDRLAVLRSPLDELDPAKRNGTASLDTVAAALAGRLPKGNPNHANSLHKAYRLLTRAEITANGGLGEAFDDLDYATCCINTRITVEFYQPDPAKPRVHNQVLVAVYDPAAPANHYVHTDGSFKAGDLTPAKFVPADSEEAKYGYVRRYAASITDWALGELTIFAVAGKDYFATAKKAGGPLGQPDIAAETADWKPAAAPVVAATPGGAQQWTAGPQQEGALVFDNGITYRLKISILNAQARPADFPAGYQALGPYDDTAIKARLGSTTPTNPAVTTSTFNSLQSSFYGLSDRVDLLARYIIRWDQEKNVTLDYDYQSALNYVSGQAFAYTSGTYAAGIIGLRAPDYARRGDLVAVRVKVGSKDLVFSVGRAEGFGSAAGPKTMPALAGYQYIFHLVRPDANNDVGSYWVVHSTPSTGGTAYDDTAIKVRLGATTADDPAAPVSAVKAVLSQALTLADAKSLVAAGTLIPGRTYIVDFGPDANGASQAVYAHALQTNLFNRYVTVITGGTAISQALANFKNGALEPLVTTSTTGIDYASEVAVSTDATATVNKAHVLQGAGCTLTLPLSASNGQALFVRVDATATGLFAIANAEPGLKLWAGESATFRQSAQGWRKAADLRPMSVRIETTPQQQNSLPQGGTNIPYSVVNGLIGPASLVGSAALPDGNILGILIQRAGTGTCYANCYLADAVPGYLYQLAILRRRPNGEVTVVGLTFLATGTNNGVNYANGTLAASAADGFAAGDVLFTEIYCGNPARLRGENAALVCLFQYKE